MRTTLLGLLLLAGAAFGDGFKVIVNAANPVSSVAKEKVAKMFLKKVSRWENGSAVVPVDQPDEAEPRRAFSEEVIGKSVAGVKSYWQQQIFSGRDVPPPERKSNDSVVAFVKDDPGAIGYVSAGADTSGVKVLTVTP